MSEKINVTIVPLDNSDRDNSSEIIRKLSIMELWKNLVNEMITLKKMER